jgi:alpha-L-arabinofuranosidase
MRKLFLTLAIVSLITVAPQLLPAASTANVTVNAAAKLSTVAATAYGVHTSVYDNQNGNASLPNLLLQSGVKALRYPGGGYADIFHWSVTRPALGGGNGYGFTPWFGMAGDYGYMGSGTDFGSFVKLLANSQCQAVITVNFGSGLKWSSSAHTSLTIPPTNAEPPEAAAWVAYANANTNIFGTTNDVTLGVDSIGNDWKTAGYWAMIRAATPLGTDDGYNFLRINHPVPIGIKYWEIGNETFGTGYYSTGTDGYSVNYAVPYPNGTFTRFGNPVLSPTTYGIGVRNFSLLMKAVDPTIKIGAVVSTPPGDYSWDTDANGQHWTPLVLAQCATNIDFVIAHWYPYAGANDNGSSLLPQVRSTIPAMINGTGTHTGTSSGLRDWINDYRADGTNVQIFITEFNYNGAETNSLNGEPVFGPVNSLFAADSYASWLDLGVANVDWLEMNKNTFLGDSSPPVAGAAYYAAQLTHDMAGVGDQIVSTTSDASTLRAHAAVQQSGKVSVMLLNEKITNTYTVNVTVSNASLGATATQIQFGTNNYSASTPTLPKSPPTTNTIAIAGNTFTVTVPAYTISVLTIPTIVSSPPVLAAISNRTVNPGQTVAFTASATDTNLPPPTLTFSLLAGAPTNATLNTNTGAFSWRPLVTQANSINSITLQVTASGNGAAPQSASQSFTVTVNPLTAPSVTSAALSNGQVGFQIGGAAGPDYAVQSSTDLVAWTTLFITNSPAPPFNWVDTNAPSLPRQFYRVKIGPPLP